MSLLDQIQETDAAMEWYPAKVDELHEALSKALGLATSLWLGNIESSEEVEGLFKPLFEVASGRRRPPLPDLGP